MTAHAVRATLKAAEPGEALDALAAALRKDVELADHVLDLGDRPALGELAAAGPRASGSEGDYAVLVEAIREGHLLHHSRSRLLPDADADLALLAGDYLYALGLDRLAELGDLEAVAELADMISLVALLLPGGGDPPPQAQQAVEALWLSTVMAVAAGASPAHAEAKEALRSGDPAAAGALAAAASEAAVPDGLDGRLTEAAEAIGFPVRELPHRG